MRKKHHYTIKRITHHYDGDYFDGHTFTEKVIYTTNKHDKALNFYENHLYEECGTEYKCCYYPSVEIIFQKDY